MQRIPLNQSLQIELDKLPSIPHALLELLKVIRDTDVSFTKISEIIQTDPALTTRVMSIANAPGRYQWSQYKDFNRLIVALGLKMVKFIAINSSVQQFFSKFNVDDQRVLARFWQTSLTTASLARALAHITGYVNEDEAYIAGLLHKLGELVCLTHNTDDYVLRIKELQADISDKSLLDIEFQQTTLEQEFVGASIPEIGAWIINGFDRDTLLGDAILFQREAAEQLIGAPHLVQLISTAHKLSSLVETHVVEQQSAGWKDSVFSEVSAVFDLNQPLLEELLANCRSEVVATAKEMCIRISDDTTSSLDNEAIQTELADNIRTIALSGSLQQIDVSHLESRSEKQLIVQIMQNLKVLFDLSNCIFLACDENSRQLHARYGTNTEEQLLTQFNITLDATETLPVQALLKRVPLSSQDKSESDKKSVLDRQLLRLLDTEEILCIPLLESFTNPVNNSEVTNNDRFGVLVAGVSSIRLQKLKREKGLLYEFSRASSEIISHDRNMTQQIQSAIEEEKSLQSLQIRKLVHEANNPLGVIRNYLLILSHKLADSQDSKLQGQLEILMEEVERVGNIVLRIRETPEKNSTANQQVNINDLVNRLLSIFNESLFLKAGIIAKMNLDTSIPPMESNANSLKQILTNLFKNAVEAMPDGGKINISTRDRVNYNGEQFIELCIADNGPGIALEILPNLFSPVSSTKTGEHSGLGLSIIKNLVNDLGGTIRGSNRSSYSLSSVSQQQDIRGAEFVILIPRKPVLN
ncbi:MAG: HDOD domain-containing protein [Gammaproteobacteria bacterium]|nr:HDOD domain-containing protein [Gammaproteobacteria bacterium]